MLRQTDASWTNPKVLSILAIIFLCGAACGSALTRGYLHAHLALHMPAAHPIEAARQVGLEHLRRQLNLTSAQEQTVTKVLDDYGKFYQNIEDEREDVAEYGRRRILDALTPEQQKRFKEIFERPVRSR